MQKPTLSIDIVIDVICPWCFLGKRRLEMAMRELADEIDFVVSYRPFQLDATLPKDGADRAEYMLARFSDQRAIDETHARLTEMGEDVDIRFAFEAIERVPNTLDAHRLIRWAAAANVAPAMVEQLFSTYFEQGGDLADRQVLLAIADELGFDTDDIADRLDSDTDVAAVEAEIAEAVRMGVSGVPCTIVERRYAISGAQPVDILVDALRRIAAEVDEIADA
jgi:predicted DsbA family dithiol-disulfide isomerase